MFSLQVIFYVGERGVRVLTEKAPPPGRAENSYGAQRGQAGDELSIFRIALATSQSGIRGPAQLFDIRGPAQRIPTAHSGGRPAGGESLNLSLSLTPLPWGCV